MSPLRDFSSSTTAVLAGVRDALSLPAWVVGLALVGVGSLARDVGHPIGAAVLSTVLIWAGPAQVIFYASIAAGASPLAIAFSVGMSSMRFMPMTVALTPLLRRPGQGIGTQVMLAHYIAVTVWTESLRRLPDIVPERRVAYYLGFANACVLASAFCTGAGYLLAGVLPGPIAAGLLFLTPVFFTLSLIAGVRRTAEAVALILGFALAPLFDRVAGGGVDLVLTGLVGGTVAFLVGRFTPRRDRSER